MYDPWMTRALQLDRERAMNRRFELARQLRDMNASLPLVALITAPLLPAVASLTWGADNMEAPQSPEWEGRLLSSHDDLLLSRGSSERGTPVVLRDGSRMAVRPLQAEDRSSVRALFERLSQRSLAQRFHSAGLRVTDAVLDTVTAGHVLVAEVEGRIVGLASYYPDAGTCQAEAAIVVEDAYQGRGVGLALGMCLYRDAHRAGIRRLRAEIQGTNRIMIKLLRRLHLPMKTTLAYGVIQVEITVEPDPADGPLTLEMPSDAA